jgi:hypothetical protein
MKLKERQDYYVARQNGKGRAMRAAKARGRTDLETYEVDPENWAPQ